MPWLQVELRVCEHDVEEAEAALEGAGALAVTLRDAGESPVLEPGPGETPMWPDTVVTGLFPGDRDPDRLRAAVRRLWAPRTNPDIRSDWLEDRPWEREWEREFRPMQFGRRLWVIPGNQSPGNAGGVIVRLSPGLAFGTGTHPTTALCLEWLDGLDLGDALVVDYGCGSGILAVAAACLGARKVIATDIDPQALVATRENAGVNKVSDRIRVVAPEELGRPQANVLIANILANPLIELAPMLGNVIESGGKLALSGILRDQVPAVAAAYAPEFVVAAPVFKEDWARLEGTRRD
jgi:ribosomal protein L11 methyltransferase